MIVFLPIQGIWADFCAIKKLGVFSWCLEIKLAKTEIRRKEKKKNNM
jgi:hypothetical protein